MVKLIQDGTKAHPFIGLATIVVKDGLILVGYDGEKLQYSFPGGFWEDKNKETSEEGAAREVFEETGGHSGVKGAGVKCTDFRKIYDHVFFREDKGVWHKSIGFTAKYESGLAADDPSEKRSSWKFMDPMEVLKLDLFEPAKKGLVTYLATR